MFESRVSRLSLLYYTVIGLQLAVHVRGIIAKARYMHLYMRQTDKG